MQQPVYDELAERASKLLEDDEQLLTRKPQAQNTVLTELEAMRKEDKILILSEEEERLLRAFRAFKSRTKPGGVFKWQTRADLAVLAAQETGLVTDPQDVSNTK